MKGAFSFLRNESFDSHIVTDALFGDIVNHSHGVRRGEIPFEHDRAMAILPASYQKDLDLQADGVSLQLMRDLVFNSIIGSHKRVSLAIGNIGLFGGKYGPRTLSLVPDEQGIERIAEEKFNIITLLAEYTGNNDYYNLLMRRTIPHVGQVRFGASFLDEARCAQREAYTRLENLAPLEASFTLMPVLVS